MGRGQDKYKRYILLAAVLLLPPAAIIAILLAASSCSGRNGQVGPVLTAADSLMMSRPEAALDTLLTLDSTVASSLRGRERADYTLLMTEARYKCWLPVAEDTAITKAAGYYRRKGPDSRLARALMMQGAVLSERGDSEGAMAAYKEAEPIFERGGDLEQLGLINTEIGMLYQTNLVNDSAAVARYRKALCCFEEAGLPERVMYAHVTLARMLMVDSSEKALPHLEKALSMSEQYEDRLCGLSASDLLCHYYKMENDADGIINTVREVLSEYGDAPCGPAEEGLYKSLLHKLVEGYVSTGDADSARYVSGLVSVTDRTDSIMMFSRYADIARLEGDMAKFWENRAMIERTALGILKDNYDKHLLESELKAENYRLESDLFKRQRSIVFLILVVFLGAAAVITVLYRIHRMLRRQKAEIASQRALADNLSRLLSAQAVSNDGLKRYFSLTYSAMRKIMDAYDIHKSNDSNLMERFADIAKEFITDSNSYSNAETVLNSIYPGFLDNLFEEFPDLREEDRYLIMLTCLGYPSGAVCAILDISETNLSTRKTRLARKMGIGKSLAKYLNEKLQ